MITESVLKEEELTVVIDIMPAVAKSVLTVAVVGSPPAGISLRKQLRDDIVWAMHPDSNRLRGSCVVGLPRAYMALVVLSIGNTSVQRQWFSDPSLSRNVRFAATQEFDRDLAKIKSRLSTTDSRAFEKAVAALMFLSGFSTLLPPEDDGPAIIGVTPTGRVVLVECTTKATDAMSKIGNLVLRREALRATFATGSHSNSLMAALVCQTPRSHMHISAKELAQHGVLLLTHEDLIQQLVRVQNPVDADELYSQGLGRLQGLLSFPEAASFGPVGG
jgi:hypothetical protein